jgi:hypothetical protein
MSICAKAFCGNPWNYEQDYLGTTDPVTVAGVIERHLDPLETCVRAMLAEVN